VTLPRIRSTRGHLLAAVTTIVLCAAMYFIPQHWQFAAPVTLPLTALDRAIPFWPESGLVYFGVFVFLLVTFFLLRDRREATRFLYASLLAQLIGMVVFLFWPTRFPRELFPLPAAASGLGRALVNYVRSTDASVNCLPSLHVSTVTICVLALRGSRGFSAALAVGVPVVVSTLTFKQHYVVDALAGAALGAGAWWTCFRWRGISLAS